MLMLFFCGCTVSLPAANGKVISEDRQKASDSWNYLQKYIVEQPKKNGDELVIAIPHSKLFNSNSANLSYSAMDILNNVVNLIAYYETVDVRVLSTIYLNGNDRLFSKSLAKEQAHRIASYLWRKNADMRIVYNEGYVKQLPAEEIIEISMQVFSKK